MTSPTSSAAPLTSLLYLEPNYFAELQTLHFITLIHLEVWQRTIVKKTRWHMEIIMGEEILPTQMKPTKVVTEA